MTFPVVLNVYDVTNTQNEDANAMVVRINSITHQIGLGGVFHGGLVVDNHEWSFGCCEHGSGVYCCVPGKNPSYKFRLQIDLGNTSKNKEQLRSILLRLKSEWKGSSYELLTRNCNHFCEALAKELECNPTPPWLNRMASGADATLTFTNEAAALARHIGSNVSSAAWWVRESVTKMLTAPKDTGVEGAESSSSYCAGIPVGSDGSIAPNHGMLFFASPHNPSLPASNSSARRDGLQSTTEEAPTSAPLPEAGFARLGGFDSDHYSTSDVQVILQSAAAAAAAARQAAARQAAAQQAAAQQAAAAIARDSDGRGITSGPREGGGPGAGASVAPVSSRPHLLDA